METDSPSPEVRDSVREAVEEANNVDDVAGAG